MSVAEADVRFASILIVDDVDLLRDELAAALRDLGIQSVFTAENITEAEQTLNQMGAPPSGGPTTWVICDLVMPGPSSVDFIVAIKHQHPQFRCTILTAQLDQLNPDERGRLENSESMSSTRWR